jgi:hypothetical protein
MNRHHLVCTCVFAVVVAVAVLTTEKPLPDCQKAIKNLGATMQALSNTDANTPLDFLASASL